MAKEAKTDRDEHFVITVSQENLPACVTTHEFKTAIVFKRGRYINNMAHESINLLFIIKAKFLNIETPLVSSSPLARSVIALFLRPQCLHIRCSSTVVVKAPKFQVEQGPYERNSFLSYGSVANAAEENKEKIDLKPTSVPVRAAYELLKAGHRYLDVRTIDEFKAGHPPSAINIPYYHIFTNGGEGMSLKNSKFLDEVSSKFGKEEKILVGCKIGRRSLWASTDLLAAGFTHVTDVAGGYTT